MDFVILAGLNVGKRFLELTRNIPTMSIKGIVVLDDRYERKIAGFQTFHEFEREFEVIKVTMKQDYSTEVKKLKPQMIISVGWSQFVPHQVLDLPTFGVVGFHYAKLPARRGGSPIPWALIDGLEETYVTMFYYSEKVDAGDIIAERRIPIDMNDNASNLIEKCEEAVLHLSSHYLPNLIDGSAPRIPQNDGNVNFTRRRAEVDDEIALDQLDPLQLHNYIRALHSPYSGAFISYKGYRVYLRDSYVIKEESN